jgi:signal transduction histidine kinase
VARQVPGAGLGLTIVLAIVEAHGGTIDVVRSDSTGTTFRMTLPLAG